MYLHIYFVKIPNCFYVYSRLFNYISFSNKIPSAPITHKWINEWITTPQHKIKLAIGCHPNYSQILSVFLLALKTLTIYTHIYIYIYIFVEPCFVLRGMQVSIRPQSWWNDFHALAEQWATFRLKQNFKNFRIMQRQCHSHIHTRK